LIEASGIAPRADRIDRALVRAVSAGLPVVQTVQRQLLSVELQVSEREPLPDLRGAVAAARS
jgi:hypothetical protein